MLPDVARKTGFRYHALLYVAGRYLQVADSNGKTRINTGFPTAFEDCYISLKIIEVQAWREATLRDQNVHHRGWECPGRYR
jgi:hypothetical protein